jgi:HK97 family phage major capsid protein
MTLSKADVHREAARLSAEAADIADQEVGGSITPEEANERLQDVLKRYKQLGEQWAGAKKTEALWRDLDALGRADPSLAGPGGQPDLSGQIATEMRLSTARFSGASYDPARMKAARRGLANDYVADAWVKAATDHLVQSKAFASSGTLNVPAPIAVGDDPGRPRYVADLLRLEVVTGTVAPYFRETTHTSAANAVATGGLKPESAYGITRIESPLAVIAHLVTGVNRIDLSDAQFLAEFIRGQMLNDLRIEIDDELVNGSAPPELIGILNTPGILTQAFATDVLTTLRKAATALQLQNFVPNGLAIHPTNAEALDLTKDTTGRFYFASSPNDGGASPVWGTRTVVSAALPVNTAILADWSNGILFMREQATVDWSEGAGGFEHNQLSARAECRVGLGVLRPRAFVKVTLA